MRAGVFNFDRVSLFYLALMNISIFLLHPDHNWWLTEIRQGKLSQWPSSFGPGGWPDNVAGCRDSRKGHRNARYAGPLK